MQKSGKSVIIIVLICAIFIVSIFAFLVNQNKAPKDTMFTQIDYTLSKDLDLDYPSTPKAVLTYYNEILDCIYGNEATEEQLRDLAEKARQLYDSELQEANEPTVHFQKLLTEVEDFQNLDRMIFDFTVASAVNTEEFTQDGYQFARLSSGYTVKDGDVNKPTQILYLLRKDASGKWRIYGWEQK
ncbi:MAG: hypothetical protein LBM69_03100 [Lachnospiraceae bacterium]|jgi:hypothetical protein|nr:hypothetical protein [Lachnospiraceae bacterium]